MREFHAYEMSVREPEITRSVHLDLEDLPCQRTTTSKQVNPVQIGIKPLEALPCFEINRPSPPTTARFFSLLKPQEDRLLPEPHQFPELDGW